LVSNQSTSSAPENDSSKVPNIVVLVLLLSSPSSSLAFPLSPVGVGGRVKLKCRAKSVRIATSPGRGRLNPANNNGADGSVEVRPEVTIPFTDLGLAGGSLCIGGAGKSFSPVPLLDSGRGSDSSLIIIDSMAAADLVTLAILSFSLILSATVPVLFSPEPGEAEEEN
jgi:hypothetical protein